MTHLDTETIRIDYDTGGFFRLFANAADQHVSQLTREVVGPVGIDGALQGEEGGTVGVNACEEGVTGIVPFEDLGAVFFRF